MARGSVAAIGEQIGAIRKDGAFRVTDRAPAGWRRYSRPAVLYRIVEGALVLPDCAAIVVLAAVHDHPAIWQSFRAEKERPIARRHGRNLFPLAALIASLLIGNELPPLRRIGAEIQ